MMGSEVRIPLATPETRRGLVFRPSRSHIGQACQKRNQHSEDTFRLDSQPQAPASLNVLDGDAILGPEIGTAMDILTAEQRAIGVWPEGIFGHVIRAAC